MAWQQPSYNPYGGQPAAGQVPGYPPGAFPPGYTPPTTHTDNGRSSPSFESSAKNVSYPQYPAGAAAYPSQYPTIPAAAGQYGGAPQQPYPSANYTPYPAQQQQPYPAVYPSAPPVVYPAVPPATGAYSYGQMPGGYSYAPQDVVGFVFTPTAHEMTKHRMEVKFSPAMDKYVRSSEHNQETAGWRQMTYAEQGIQRKVEEDWKMAYLTRKESTVVGRIEWRFDVTATGRRVSKLRVQFPVKLYEDGNVNAYVATDRGTLAPLVDSAHSQEIDAARGSQRFSIIAELSRGKDQHAWQHAQLFRQQLNPGFFSTDDSHFPFRVLVEFE